MLLVLPACGGETDNSQSEVQETTAAGEVAQSEESTEQWETVESVNPEDILSEEERTGLPEVKNWNEPSGEEPIQLSSVTSAGAIPAVKPFNFGRDPGGPEDKTLYLTIPKLGLKDAPVYDSLEEEELKESTIHVPATGFPWQDGANTYIAGHRLGYPDTGSFYVFYDLDKLAAGDDVSVKDADGNQYEYRITGQKVVGLDNVEVMNAAPGKSMISLQTCTLPDYAERIVVQGELVEQPA